VDWLIDEVVDGVVYEVVDEVVHEVVDGRWSPYHFGGLVD